MATTSSSASPHTSAVALTAPLSTAFQEDAAWRIATGPYSPTRKLSQRQLAPAKILIVKDLTDLGGSCECIRATPRCTTRHRQMVGTRPVEAAMFSDFLIVRKSSVALDVNNISFGPRRYRHPRTANRDKSSPSSGLRVSATMMTIKLCSARWNATYETFALLFRLNTIAMPRQWVRSC
jgi:hypothetical protein